MKTGRFVSVHGGGGGGGGVTAQKTSVHIAQFKLSVRKVPPAFMGGSLKK